MRAPKQYAESSDTEIIVRLDTPVSGKLEAKKKLGDLPTKTAAKPEVSRN